jgi:hypothetical protein
VTEGVSEGDTDDDDSKNFEGGRERFSEGDAMLVGNLRGATDGESVILAC